MNWDSLDNKPTAKDILNSCKTQLSIHIKMLQDMGVYKSEIEIELVQFIRNQLKSE